MSEAAHIPQLRFPEYSANWSQRLLSDFLIPTLREIEKPKVNYLAIGLRSHCKGTFQKPDSDPSKIAMEKLFRVKENDLIVNITFAWEGAIAIVKENDEGGLVSHRFPTYTFDTNITSHHFFKHQFINKRFRYLLDLISPGGAGRNRVMSKKEFVKLKVPLPSVGEQQKIAAFLTAVDNKIEQLSKKQALLGSWKKGLMQQIFSQAIRFKADDGSAFPVWKEKKLGDILDYEQPTNYIVDSTEYDNSFDMPVLTAGKSFILGYTNETHKVFENIPVIIFDDFTTANKYVDFPFKVKSSAMKILKPKDSFVNIRLIFEFIQMLNFPIGEHKRYWISEYQDLKIPFPSFEEQTKIASFLSSIDNKIEQVGKQLDESKQFKKALLQQMFV